MKRIQSLFALAVLGFLLISSSFAQDPLTKEQQEDVLGGFLDGLGVDSDITPEGLPEAGNLVNSVNLLEGNTKEEAIDGLKILAGVLDKLPGIIDNIDGNDGADDLFLDGMETIAEDLDSFEINAHEGDEANEIVVRGVSLSQAMNESATQLKAGDFYEAGWAIGDALAEVYLEITPPASEKIAEEVKSKAKGWEAGSPDQVTKGYKSLHDFAKAKLGVPDALIKSLHKKKRMMRRNGLVHVSKLRKEDFPENFDAREKWPNCIGPIRSQGECGSCWAYAGTSAFADRVCIASGGKIKKTLSTQYAVNCGPEPDMNACDGGWPDKEFQWFETAGVWQDSCLSYTSGNDPKRGECRTQCQDEAEPNILYAKEGSTFVFGKDQTLEIKKELMTNGPMSTVFDCYDDFTMYKSGIYSHTSGGTPGGHAVKLIGWGKDPATGVEYWLCANSWGADWGDKGYFKIKFGDSNINEQVTAALPDFERSVLSNKNGPDVPEEDNSGNTAGAEFKKDKEQGGDSEEQPVDNGEPPVEEPSADQPTNEEEQPPPEESADYEGGSDQSMLQERHSVNRVAHQQGLRGNQRSAGHRRRSIQRRREPIRRNEVVQRRKSVVKHERRTHPAHHTGARSVRKLHHN